jgi:oxaloacetate decarboxylase (Na+ extruding) subunit alpha
VRRSAFATAGRELPDRDVVLASVLPADQLDAMRAAGPAPTWSPQRPATVTSAAEFVAAVGALPHWRSIDVQLGDERVRLRRDGSTPEEAP